MRRNDHGSILLMAAGLSVVMVVLALTFFNRMRVEARAADGMVQDVQARIVLHGAINYIQEAARLGYSKGNPLNFDRDYSNYPRIKDQAWAVNLPTSRDSNRGNYNEDSSWAPYRHESDPSVGTTDFEPYGAASFVDHWNADDTPFHDTWTAPGAFQAQRNALGDIMRSRFDGEWFIIKSIDPANREIVLHSDCSARLLADRKVRIRGNSHIGMPSATANDTGSQEDYIFTIAADATYSSAPNETTVTVVEDFPGQNGLPGTVRTSIGTSGGQPDHWPYMRGDGWGHPGMLRVDFPHPDEPEHNTNQGYKLHAPQSGDPDTPPNLTDADGASSAFGAYVGSGSAEAHTRRSWVGWYTPHHRGYYLTPWHAQDAPVLSWWMSSRQAPDLWQPRFRSMPTFMLHGLGADTMGTHGDTYSTGSGATLEQYYDGHRAEIIDHWPVGGPPKLFQFYRVEEPPFAEFGHLVHLEATVHTHGDDYIGGSSGQGAPRKFWANNVPWGYWPGPMLRSQTNYYVGQARWGSNPDRNSAYHGSGFFFHELVGKKVIRRFMPDVYQDTDGARVGGRAFFDPHPVYHPDDTDVSMLVDPFNPTTNISDPDSGRTYELTLNGSSTYPFDGNQARWMGAGTVLDYVRDSNGNIVRYDGPGISGNVDPAGQYVRLAPKLRRDAGGEVITDGSGDPVYVQQADPVSTSTDKTWFRIYRESHDTFIVTVGSGPSHGWRVRSGVIESRGSDVIAGEPCPFATASELEDAIANDVRYSYRICWQPSVPTNRNWDRYPLWSNQAGSIKYVQRLFADDIAALAAAGKDW